MSVGSMDPSRTLLQQVGRLRLQRGNSLPEETHICYPFPANAFIAFDGASVKLTYFNYPQDAEVSTVTGTLVAVNGTGIVVKKVDEKHVWIHLDHLIGMEEQ